MYIHGVTNGGETLLPITLSTANSQPYYQQIIDQIRNLILSGHLAPGAALPSVRTLARQLTVSVITTRRAYDELEQAGFICTRAGVGSFVADADSKQIDAVRRDHVRALLAAAFVTGQQMGLTRAQLQALIDEELSHL